MTEPKMGDQIVSPPDTQIVTEPVVVPGPSENCIILDDGSEMDIPDAAGQAKMFRVLDGNRNIYEHVGETAEGEWIYRRVD